MNNTSSELNPWEYQNVALAGIAQSAALVHSLAHTGSMADIAARASINSLLALNPMSTKDVYPTLAHWNLGLQTVQALLSSDRAARNPEVTRYILGLMILRGQFMSNKALQERVRGSLSGIAPLPLEQTGNQASDGEQPAGSADSGYDEDETFQQIASLYQDTISTLPYRIQVQGKIEHLKNARTANRIRALLLAGLRSAVLWHQLGGRRWRLLIYRKRIHSTTTAIRRKLIVTV